MNIEIEQAAEALSTGSILLSLEVKTFGNLRTIPKGQFEAGDADKALLHMSKQLLARQELKDIESLFTETRRWLDTRALPSLFRRGVYRLPSQLLEQTETYLQAAAGRLQIKVDRLLTVYVPMMDSMSHRLGRFFSAMDYPTQEQLRAAFSIRWRYFSGQPVEELQFLSAEQQIAYQSKIKEEVQAEVEEVRSVLRAELKILVDHAHKRLTGQNSDGKPMVFRDTLLGNLNGFLDLFDKRDITNDQEFKRLVDEARALSKGIDPKLLRKNPDVRAEFAYGLTHLKTSLDGMMIERPSRRIKLLD